LTASIHYSCPNKDNKNKLNRQAIEGEKIFVTYSSAAHLAEPQISKTKKDSLIEERT